MEPEPDMLPSPVGVNPLMPERLRTPPLSPRARAFRIRRRSIVRGVAEQDAFTAFLEDIEQVTAPLARAGLMEGRYDEVESTIQSMSDQEVRTEYKNESLRLWKLMSSKPEEYAALGSEQSDVDDASIEDVHVIRATVVRSRTRSLLKGLNEEEALKAFMIGVEQVSAEEARAVLLQRRKEDVQEQLSMMSDEEVTHEYKKRCLALWGHMRDEPEQWPELVALQKEKPSSPRSRAARIRRRSLSAGLIEQEAMMEFAEDFCQVSVDSARSGLIEGNLKRIQADVTQMSDQEAVTEFQGRGQELWQVVRTAQPLEVDPVEEDGADPEAPGAETLLLRSTLTKLRRRLILKGLSEEDATAEFTSQLESVDATAARQGLVKSRAEDANSVFHSMTDQEVTVEYRKQGLKLWNLMRDRPEEWASFIQTFDDPFNVVEMEPVPVPQAAAPSKSDKRAAALKRRRRRKSFMAEITDEQVMASFLPEVAMMEVEAETTENARQACQLRRCQGKWGCICHKQPPMARAQSVYVVDQGSGL